MIGVRSIGRAASTIGMARASDEELARRAVTERAAFGELYDRYLEPVHGYCYRKVGNREAAEDLTSIVFTKALASIGSYREGAGTFRAWLFTIARNAITDEFRSRRPAAPLDDGLAISSPAAGPEEIALKNDASREVRALLAHLPATDAEILELRLAELTDKEIATVLGRSHGAIRIAQHRALKRLRGLLLTDSKDNRDG